jgi:serine/threonine protein kinase
MTEPNPWIQIILNNDLGLYQVEEYRGRGGFALVFAAKDSQSGGVIALKVAIPTSKSEDLEEFEREGTLLKQLTRSSNVVKLHNSDQHEIPMSGPAGEPVPINIRFHVLDLAEGCLEELVLERDELSWEERLRLWRGIVLGVHQMHLKQIVHRDLKSENCLLFPVARRRMDCRVADLGRSRDLKTSGIHSISDYLQGRGDLRFAPPEFLWLQGADTPDAHRQADLYGLGSVFYELATGQAITSMSFGFGPALINLNYMQRQQGQVIDLGSLRGNYKVAFEALALELPKIIRDDCLKLIRQLCDPDPEKRSPNPKIIRSQRKPESLEWLLRRIDILIRRLTTSSKLAKNESTSLHRSYGGAS